jgi:hypothetical protein
MGFTTASCALNEAMVLTKGCSQRTPMLFCSNIPIVLQEFMNMVSALSYDLMQKDHQEKFKTNHLAM